MRDEIRFATRANDRRRRDHRLRYSTLDRFDTIVLSPLPGSAGAEPAHRGGRFLPP